MSGGAKLALFFVLIAIPAGLSAITAKLAFQRAETVEFCASCHVMTPWIENVTDPASDSLAAEHFKRRLIQHDQCYTCHSNYGFLGPLKAKIEGAHHVAVFYFGKPEHIALYNPFPNENCLQCHRDGAAFRDNPVHEPIEDLLSGKSSCIDCHDNLHGVKQEGDKPTAAAETGKDGGSDAGK